ncbi:MAG: hypothetical protein AVDCRST_MAG80-2450 [uncultured Rubrobacteraceae bacterium]|uniref:Methyltransferase type 11 domain-containing protein n=1 Tax=uncultured Rubrobacteraceae bacterium TaxID=349277 RepID=A0A6J4QUJ0_9ACTN|nr:MAG: hypothetical protein AVDCRST_MAG80-2450 [uncultured Rubrobacteraceae bacterium]
MRVLDVGGGLGGPARNLASEIGCSVEVLDVTEEFCRAGEILTTRTGLGDLVSFRHASALDMPHPDASFDVVWMQHSSMNIADKERLYAEIHRVLRPGGHLALHEIMAGPVTPIHFPVPWARGPEISFLRPPEEVRALITGIGFEESAWMTRQRPPCDGLGNDSRQQTQRPESCHPSACTWCSAPTWGKCSRTWRVTCKRIG